jgi:pyoverdine/dityrosine biosynthesis protein Dit1
MAVQKKFDNITFARLTDLLDFPVPEKMTEITYVANCTTFRRLLLNKYGRDNLDIDNEISSKPDTKLTYLGYKRFLESDLKHIYPRGAGRSAHSYKRDCKYIAKQMLIRGDVGEITFVSLHLGLVSNNLFHNRPLHLPSSTPFQITYGFPFTNQ